MNDDLSRKLKKVIELLKIEIIEKRRQLFLLMEQYEKLSEDDIDDDIDDENNH